MSIFEAIVDNFNKHLYITSRSIDDLTPHIAESTHLFTETLLADKKILCCTSGESFAAGWQFTHNLLSHVNLQRPSLPVLFLGGAMTTMIDHQSGNEIYTKLIQALGNKGDVLFIISARSDEKNLINAVITAHQKEMHVIALLSEQSNDIAAAIDHSDVAIQIASSNIQQIVAMQFFACQSLAELIEQQLFGTITS